MEIKSETQERGGTDTKSGPWYNRLIGKYNIKNMNKNEEPHQLPVYVSTDPV